MYTASARSGRMGPPAPISRSKSRINHDPMKRILLLLLSGMSAVHLLGQTPYGQYDIIFNVDNIYTSANTDGNCPNYFRIHLLLSSGYSDVWDVLSGIGSSPTSWSKKYTVPSTAGQAPTIPASMFIEAGRSWNHTIGGCSGPSGNGAPLSLPTSPCTVQNYGSIVPQWSSTVTAQIVPDNVTIYDTYDLNHYLPDNDPVELTATQGFAGSVDDWQYCFDEPSWTVFPGAYQHQSTITFSGAQMTGSLGNFDQAIQQ